MIDNSQHANCKSIRESQIFSTIHFPQKRYLRLSILFFTNFKIYEKEFLLIDLISTTQKQITGNSKLSILGLFYTMKLLVTFYTVCTMTHKRI